MESSLESISIIKEENNGQNKENINNKRKILEKEEEINFDKSLELSKIEVIDEQIKEKNKNEEDINDILDYSFIKENNTIKDKKFIKNNKSKITKEELNNIPLPIFSCIYCCNENISFNHLSKEIISNKYLFQTSVYDMNQLDNLISGKRANNKLYDIVINNYENLNDYYNKEKIGFFFDSKKFGKKCEKSETNTKKKFRIKFEEKVNKKKKDFYFKEIKGMHKISKNSLNNKCLFNSNSIINNYSSLAGLIPTGPELIQNFAEKKNNSLNSSHVSNLNMQGNAWKKNEIGLIGKDNNKHYVENIIEKIDKNVESDILDFLGVNDLKRKINKKDIDWEETYYDINKPIIDDDIFETSKEKEENVLNYSNNIHNKNRNRININIKYENKLNNNDSKHISINSENKSNIKISIFNISKSLASTNTSSNIIQKNKENKENKSLSVFLKKSNIFNFENNSMLSPRYNNLIIKDKRKAQKELKENNLSPSISKIRKNDCDTKSFKRLFGNGNSCLDLKNIHKKILFNHTVNINKDLNENKNVNNNHIDIDIKTSKLNIKESPKNLFLYSSNKNQTQINKENPGSKSYNKYKFLLNNNIKNNEVVNNRTFLDKMIKRFKSNKDGNKKQSTFNSVFKLNNKNIEQSHFKSRINNIKYSLIMSNKEKKINILNFSKKGTNIKNLESEYINNLMTPKINNKENNVLEKQFITENNNKTEGARVNMKLYKLKNEIRIIS